MSTLETLLPSEAPSEPAGRELVGPAEHAPTPEIQPDDLFWAAQKRYEVDGRDWERELTRIASKAMEHGVRSVGEFIHWLERMEIEAKRLDGATRRADRPMDPRLMPMQDEPMPLKLARALDQTDQLERLMEYRQRVLLQPLPRHPD